MFRVEEHSTEEFAQPLAPHFPYAALEALVNVAEIYWSNGAWIKEIDIQRRCI
ncbi:hypothetical protein [Serpentinicella alkaliphila]|uniref:hypothetical protein n=1 Tax=Serpentinicella alkaliphila TaxID=1734049 RepID=UPI001404D50D|nr:hypothetical protein [Serpentinicella alkaliphila]QUH24496.1 hypothetical protein HZR23_00905 [Serpentinicella alkaliphila]